MKLGVCISCTGANLKDLRHKPIFVSLMPLLDKYSADTYPQQRAIEEHNRRTVGRFNLWMCLFPSLRRNYAVKTFPRQQEQSGSFGFYASHLVSEESRRLGLPGTFCLVGVRLLVVGSGTDTSLSATQGPASILVCILALGDVLLRVYS
jgi:hypothetical protein